MHYPSLFYPKSVALVGASRKLGSVGNDMIKNLSLQGYKGKIYPVNPEADTLCGLPVYKNLSDIKDPVDLVIIVVPAAIVPEVLKQAGQIGAKAAIIISAGFKEIGNIDLETEVKTICQKYDISLIGPNCLGLINPQIRLNASFATIMPEFGNIAFVSQSGALCSSVLDYAREYNLGFSKFLSIGNKARIDEIALLKYFKHDPQTKVIAMYVEELQNAPEFIKTAHEVIRGKNPKPIIILKSGRTTRGAAAIASHTGSLAGGDKAYEALFSQAGIIRANTIRELFEFIDIFSHNYLQPVKNVTIVTNAGGPGVIATDEIVRKNLDLTELSPDTKAKLKEFLPKAASVNNPVDILGDAGADRYQKTLEVIATDPNTDAVLVLLTPQTSTNIEGTAKALVAFKQLSTKPIVASFMGKETVEQGVRIMERNQVSTTAFPELAARGLSSLRCFMNHSQKTNEHFNKPAPVSPTVTSKLNILIKQGVNHLPEAQALEVLESYHFPILKRMVINDSQSLSLSKTYFNSPVALKIVSPDIIHKSDVGGVILGVTPDQIETKYHQLLSTVTQNAPQAKIEGALAVEMAPTGGIELIAGINHVPGLGHLIMLGLGGVYVEVFKDIQFGFAPLSSEYIDTMIIKIKIYPILQGTRGQSGYDLKTLKKVLMMMSDLCINHPEIKELDINPLLLLPKGARVLDARIMI